MINFAKVTTGIPNTATADEVTAALEAMADDYRGWRDEYKYSFPIADGVPIGIIERDVGIMVIGENIAVCGQFAKNVWLVAGIGARSYPFSPLDVSLQFMCIGAFPTREEAVACAVCAAGYIEDTDQHIDPVAVN